MKRPLIVLALCLLISSLSSAQKPAPAPSPSTDPGPSYEDLVKKVSGGDLSIDFKALRIAFTKTKDYSSDGDDDDMKAVFAALDDKKFKMAADLAEAILKSDYVSMDAHIGAAFAYRGLGDTAKADLHKSIYLGLVNSIVNTADGKTPATAYVVISVHEEYVVLRALGLRPGNQSLVNQGGHTFDVLDASDAKTNAAVKLYFNIDISWKAETDMFKKEE